MLKYRDLHFVHISILASHITAMYVYTHFMYFLLGLYILRSNCTKMLLF